MKYLRPAIRSCSGLLLAGAVLFQVSFLQGQAIPIAVVEFEGNGISQTEAIALTDRLRNELFRLGTFEVVDRGMMENILTEQDFQMAGCTSNECLVEVGRLLGAKQMMGGSISKVGAMFTVSARVVDVETGKVLSVSDFDLRGGLEEMLTEGMKQVALTLSRSLPKEEASSAEVAAIDKAVPDEESSDKATTPTEKRPDIKEPSQPAGEGTDDQRPRTWSINAGIGSSRNSNFLEITKDIIVGRNLSLFVSAGIALESEALAGGGITYQRHYNEKGLIGSASLGFLPYEGFETNTLIAYQWPLGRRGFLVTGAALVIFLEDLKPFPYPVLSYEYRF